MGCNTNIDAVTLTYTIIPFVFFAILSTSLYIYDEVTRFLWSPFKNVHIFEKAGRHLLDK
jgi:hypothetical protein